MTLTEIASAINAELTRLGVLYDARENRVVLVRDKDGNLEIDDANRCKMRLRPHDAEIGVLWDVVERHGKNALECEAYLPIHRKMTQLVFQFG